MDLDAGGDPVGGGDELIRLWLDDERPAPEGWTHVRTAGEAIEVIATGGVVEVSFDHDLGVAEAGTGYELAVWIEERAATGEIAELNWAVHSANPVGRARIEAAMRSAERFWFRRMT